MDSEEDMQDAYTSEEDYSDGMPTDGEDDESGFAFEDASMEDFVPVSRLPQQNYHIMSEDEICKRQDEAVKSVANVLSISKTEASILLRHHRWCISTVNDEWFANEKRVRKAVGLLDRVAAQTRPLVKEMTCSICFDPHSIEKMKAAACTHYFCESCWRAYIHTSIADGPGCLSLRCPDTCCSSAVGEDMIRALVPAEDWKKYRRYLLRSFVEDSRQAKWCPGPGCDYAVEYSPGAGTYEIVCKCNHNFCWNCLEESHRPVDCETVGKWILKNSAESENMNWILANSKPCPKCRRPIEKFTGCMHMTCTPPCKYEFCWLCLGPWTEHGERTGGFYACNRYEAAKQEGVYDEAERRREMAKSMLERYTHYYERWATNEASRTKALEDYHKMQAVDIEKLSDRQSIPVSQLKFVTDALLQVVECRRILKWTYAYGYYIPENEHTKRQFFEYVQGEAEAGLERLHQCSEKELQGFTTDDEPTSSISFTEFRTKLTGLTSVTRTYFENLVRALENGLADVDNSKAIATSKSAGSSKASGSSKGKSKKASGSSRSGGTTSRGIDDTGHWSCNLCTFANENSVSACAMCTHPRD